MYSATESTMKSNATCSSLLAAMGLLFCLSTQPALGLVTVIVQPSSQVAFVGSNVVFTAQVNATAGEIITGFTWLTSPNGLNPFTTVPGATTAACTLINVQTNNSGYYFVRVTYNSGTSNGLPSVSSAVTLTVVDQARITAQPQGGLIRTVGTNASFSVSAVGFPPPGYQWRFNGTNLVDNGRISGANGTNLTVSALVTTDSGNYDVVVTNAYSAVTSQVATLSVYLPAGISVPPQNTAVLVGSNAVFSVTASGSEPLSYQWQKGGMNLVDGGRISGATSNVLTIAATTINDAGDYTVCVTNPVSASTCAVATLTVLVPVQITSATNASGKQGVAFSFTTTATGTAPIVFGASDLPAGLSFDPVTGVIAGTPIVSGTFPISISAANLVNTDLVNTNSQVLTLTIASSVPVITSATSRLGDRESRRLQLHYSGERFADAVWGVGAAAGVDGQHQHRGHYRHAVVWRHLHSPDLGDQRVGHRLDQPGIEFQLRHHWRLGHYRCPHHLVQALSAGLLLLAPGRDRPGHQQPGGACHPASCRCCAWRTGCRSRARPRLLWKAGPRNSSRVFWCWITPTACLPCPGPLMRCRRQPSS